MQRSAAAAQRRSGMSPLTCGGDAPTVADGARTMRLNTSANPEHPEQLHDNDIILPLGNIHIHLL
jgi:hypothetical protein